MIQAAQSILDRCSTAKTFCVCLSPRTGALIISILGLLPSICYTTFYSNGTGYLTMYGVPEHAAVVIVYIFTVLGILCLIMHLFLMASFVISVEGLVTMYLWFIIVYLFFDVGLMCLIGLMAVQKGYIMFALSLIIYEVISWLIVGLLILPVVNGYRRTLRQIIIKRSFVDENNPNESVNV